MKEISTWVGIAIFWGYIVVKIWGTAFATWSAWWALMPIIPWLWLGLVRGAGL